MIKSLPTTVNEGTFTNVNEPNEFKIKSCATLESNGTEMFLTRGMLVGLNVTVTVVSAFNTNAGTVNSVGVNVPTFTRLPMLKEVTL